MSRLRFLPFLTLTFCAAAAWLLVWDVRHRAVEAVDKHRWEVNTYFGQAEDQASARPPVFDPPAAGTARETYREALPAFDAARASMSPADFTLERATARLAAFRPHLERFRIALRQPWTPPIDPDAVGGGYAGVADVLRHIGQVLAESGRDREALELLWLSFGLAQDFIRVGADEAVGGQLQVLLDGATNALRALESHALSAPELQSLSADLDRLDARWPSLSASFERGRLLWKKKALAASPEEAASRASWKDLGSPTVFTARSLAEIDAHHRAAADRGRRPSWERVRAVPHGDGDHAVFATLHGVYFCCAPNLRYETEVNALEARALLRVALAISQYAAETNKPPASLAELAPLYVKEIPVSPLDGKPFEFAEGKLISRDAKGEPRAWVVKRR